MAEHKRKKKKIELCSHISFILPLRCRHVFVASLSVKTLQLIPEQNPHEKNIVFKSCSSFCCFSVGFSVFLEFALCLCTMNRRKFNVVQARRIQMTFRRQSNEEECKKFMTNGLRLSLTLIATRHQNAEHRECSSWNNATSKRLHDLAGMFGSTLL